MNRIFGLVSGLGVAVTTALFAGSVIINLAYVSYGLSLILSWAYVLLACSLAAEATESRRSAVYAGLVFAGLYASFVGVVYFVQLTTVMQNGSSDDIMKVLSYRQHGSLMFNLDLFGYAMMAISTFFIGLAIIPKSNADRVLRTLLILHGAFAPACVLLPMFNVFGAMPGDDGDFIGITALLVWSVYFTPVGVLSFYHFQRRD